MFLNIKSELTVTSFLHEVGQSGSTCKKASINLNVLSLTEELYKRLFGCSFCWFRDVQIQWNVNRSLSCGEFSCVHHSCSCGC